MVAFAERFVNDRSSAEDVVVGLLGRWLERPPNPSSVDRIGAFLATSVYHAAIDWIRRERAQQGRSPRREPDQSVVADRRRAGPVRELNSMESREAMQRRLASALERLSASERLLLESHYGHALTAQECMDNLGISRPAFHQRLHRARVHLAQALAEEEATT